MNIDQWPWGREQIIWGFDPAHSYTLKVLEPKQGRAGCLSLQYHHEKSESWVVLRGVAWALLIVGDRLCTRILRPRDIQNLPAGTIHRLAAVSADLQVLEPSTPDAHAADKKVVKDVVRLACVFGREVAAPRSESERALIAKAVQVTEEAMEAIAAGREPVEIDVEIALFLGQSRIL